MKPVVLEGSRVRLEPLEKRHFQQLSEIGNDPTLWEFTYQTNLFSNAADARAWFDHAMASGNIPFAVIDKNSGDVAGSTRYFDIDEANRKLEIGYTFLGRAWWRTGINTEMKLLLLTHAFEQWNALRVQLKAQAVNRRSHNAILRLGATHEGTLRNFRIRANGEVSDVNIYSITVEEWPQVKQRLISLLERSPGILALG